MKGCAVIAALVTGVAFPVFADDTPPARAQQTYSPRLADIMIATQLRHFKLWYAGQVKNWKLAQYELTQVKATFEDATRFYPDIPIANMTTMMKPADEVGSAIEAKDTARFAKAFSRLTSACNSCHEAAGFGYVVIKEPRLSPIETSPFSNELFSPK